MPKIVRCIECKYMFPTVNPKCIECKHGLNNGKGVSNFTPLKK